MKNTNLFYKTVIDQYHIGIKIDICSVKNSRLGMPRNDEKFSVVFTDFLNRNVCLR